MNGWTLMLRIAVAVFVGAIIGAEREMKNRPAGMRTHVLVCLGAAIVALIEQMAIAQAVQLQAVGLINVSIGRITASVVSGVGFLGAGTIVLSERHICGLTTAASLWCTACIGLAAGAGYLGAAVISGLVVLVVLRLMQRVSCGLRPTNVWKCSLSIGRKRWRFSMRFLRRWRSQCWM